MSHAPLSRPLVSSSRPTVLFFVALLVLLPDTAEAQLFDRLRDRVEEAVTDAVECVLGDRVCIEEAEASGQDVVVTDGQGNPVEGPGDAAAVSPAAVGGELEAEVTREVLGELAQRGAVYAVSPDGAHAAVPGLQGSRQVAVVDGVQGPAFDAVDFGTFTFSETGGSHAYVARRGQECIIVVDHQERGAFEPSGQGCALHRDGSGGSGPPFKFSRDGAHLSWVRILPGGQAQVVFDGVPGPTVFRSGLTWVVRGDRVFYASGSPQRGSAGERLYVGHEPGPEYRSIRSFGVTDDGEHYVYHAVDAQGDEHVVVDGREHDGYDAVGDLVLDVRSGAVFYAARRGNESWYVFNDRVYRSADTGLIAGVLPMDRNLIVTEGRAVSHLVGVAGFPTACVTLSPSTPFSGCPAVIRRNYSVRFSPDGTRHAFRNRSGVVYVDGERSLEYEEVTEMGFTSDGSTFVFIARTGGRSFVVVDGEELGPFDRASNLTFSENGDRWAFKDAVQRAEQWYVRGEPVGREGDLGDLFFSADGSRFAFASRAGVDRFVVVDGEIQDHGLGGFVAPGIPPTNGGARQTPYVTEPFVFGPDGRLAYVAQFQRQGRALMLDGERIDELGAQNAANLGTFSPSGEHFAYLRGIQRSGEPMLWRLVVDGQTGPVVADAVAANRHLLTFEDESSLRVIGFLEGEIVRHSISF